MIRSNRASIRNRIRNSKAFTVSEALVALTIVLLVTAIVAAGIPAAANAYNKVVMVSNSQVLLSTTMSTLRNELLTASDVQTKGTANSNGQYSKLVYYNASIGAVSSIFRASSGDSEQTDNEGAGNNTESTTVSEKEGTIMFQRYALDELITGDSTITVSNPVRLMSREVSDKDKELYVTFGGVKYENDIVTFYDIAVMNKNDRQTAYREKYSIRIITDDLGEE